MIFALLMNAGIFFWWLHPWRLEKDVGTGMGSVTQKAPVRSPRDTGSEGMAAMPGSHGPQPDTIMKTEGGLSAGSQDGAAVVSAQAHRPSSEKTGGDKRIINMSELPSSVRLNLPDLAISGHFFDSRPSSRIVTIGGKTLHEGDVAAPGVKIERITPDGAVFSFEGYSFHRGVF